MTEEKPNYYAIIPANVRYDKRLTPNSKLLYAEITALCNMNGKCFATNNYFAKLFEVSKVSISKWINELVSFGYIQSKIIYKEGSKEILNRYLTILNTPIKEKFNTPIKEKLKDNNINLFNNNIIYNNNIQNDEDEELKKVFQIWLDYKKEKKQAYKPIGEQTAFNHLKKYSNGDVELAKQIIEDAMAKNYMGFFPPKQPVQAQNKNLSVAKQEKMILIEEGRFYIDDTMEEYKEVLEGMPDAEIEKVWLWIFKNKQGQEVPQSWIIERIKQFKQATPQKNQNEALTFSEINNILNNRG